MPDEYTWDIDKRRYISPKGKVITPTMQKKLAAQVVDKSAAVMEQLGTRYVAGTISHAEWASAMREAVKNVHSSTVQFAYGGKSQMGPRELGKLGQTIKEQNKFLSAFVNEVERGVVGDAGIINRSQMYGEAAYSSYESSINDREKEAGMTEERSFLEPEADHCEECFDEASKGWSPIDSLIPVGERQCLVRCQCSFEYR